MFLLIDLWRYTDIYMEVWCINQKGCGWSNKNPYLNLGHLAGVGHVGHQLNGMLQFWPFVSGNNCNFTFVPRGHYQYSSSSFPCSPGTLVPPPPTDPVPLYPLTLFCQILPHEQARVSGGITSHQIAHKRHPVTGSKVILHLSVNQR